MKLFSGSRSYNFRFFIACRFLTLRKQMFLNRYVNYWYKQDKQLIDRGSRMMYTYLSNGSFLLPFWFIRKHFIQNFSWTTALLLWSKIALIVRHVSYFKFAARAIKPHFHATSSFSWNRSIVSVRVPTFSATDAFPVTPTRFSLATSRVSLFPDRPAMSSGASNSANPSITRSVYGSQPMVTSHYSASRLNTAGHNYTCTAASTGPANVRCFLPAPLPTSENLLAMIASAMEKMKADRGLRAMQVLNFDGSPENYPLFRQRFHNNTLVSVHCFGEMNIGNLEKMILRLPKWAQAKFCEDLRNLESQGQPLRTWSIFLMIAQMWLIIRCSRVLYLRWRLRTLRHPLRRSTPCSRKEPRIKVKMAMQLNTIRKPETARCVPGHIPSVDVRLSNNNFIIIGTKTC